MQIVRNIIKAITVITLVLCSYQPASAQSEDDKYELLKECIAKDTEEPRRLIHRCWKIMELPDEEDEETRKLLLEILAILPHI